MIKSNKLKKLTKNTYRFINSAGFIGNTYMLVNRDIIEDPEILELNFKIEVAKNENIVFSDDNEDSEDVKISETIKNFIDKMLPLELKRVEKELGYKLMGKDETLKIGEYWYNKKFIDIFLKDISNINYKQAEDGLLSLYDEENNILCFIMALRG